MATIQEEILDAFYAKLAASPEFDKAMVDAVRALFDSGKKLKADDLAAIFAKGKKENAP